MAHEKAEAQPELEAKYDVDDDFVLPSLQSLVPDGSVETVPVLLESTYYDTADRRLLGTRLTLRRRTGDLDTGWQLKVPSGDARIELRWPLGRGTAVPASIREVARGVVGRSALAPVAVLTVERSLHRLLSADGTCLAEVTDDRVSAAAGGGAAQRWREVEVELADGPRKLLDRAGKVLVEAGAAPSASASKVGRALGVPSSVSRPSGSLQAVLGAYLDAQWETIVRGDLDLRRGELPVHGTRTAIRRYRSALREFSAFLDADRAAALETELQSFALALGELRDNEVQRTVMASLIESLPADIDPVPVQAYLDDALDADRALATENLNAWLRGARHARLLAELRAWHSSLPLDPSIPASAAVKVLKRADKKASKRLAALPKHHHADDERMHRARKAAKRARYVAELAAADGVGKQSLVDQVRRRNKKVQRNLGDRQDAVVAMALLSRVADGALGTAAFGLGVLHELARARAEN